MYPLEWPWHHGASSPGHGFRAYGRQEGMNFAWTPFEGLQFVKGRADDVVQFLRLCGREGFHKVLLKLQQEFLFGPRPILLAPFVAFL